MKNKYFKWKNGVVVLLSAIVCACSDNSDLAQIVNKHDQESGTRTAELKTKTIELDAIGTLETQLMAAMGEEDVSTLEKLIVSGPMGAADFNYINNSLSGLLSLDMEDAEIKESEIEYSNPNVGSWNNGRLKNDSIRQYMFKGMETIQEIVLPSSTKYIGGNAFEHCRSLTSIVIPDNVKKIEPWTFSGCNALISITLSPNLEGIEYEAFSNCNSLKSIVIPDKVKYIGSDAFSNCKMLSSVEFQSSSELDSIANWAFADTNLKSITIPDKVRKIGSYSFNSCDSLSSVTLPSELQEIETELFRSCSQLESIVIPDKVKYIGSWSFAHCWNLTSVSFSTASRTSVSSLDSIANYAFYNTNLKSIFFPDNVRVIEYNAFESCDSLATVTLPSNLESLGSAAFEFCYSLTSIDIPDKVKQINEYTFRGCPLESIVFPSNLESIGGYAFSRCAFKNIELPSTLKTLSGCSFEYCYSLESINIPSGVEHIGGHAFYDCYALKELTIPETVTSIEGGFANYANNLHAIIWKAPVDVPYNNGTNNCFLYIETDQDIAYDEGSWNNVIKNGVAQSTITIESRNNEFICYKEFTAPEVVYTRYFGDYTIPGGSSGWQTIVLPFTPDSIGHESKGEIAPFNSDKEGTKPFWLRELTADGFVDVTTIEPDKPYIIAMPNHSDYLDEYRLNGTITFSAKNVTIKKTPDTLQPSVGPDFDFHPTYKFVKKALYVYALSSQYINDNQIKLYYSKNCFARSSNDVAAFNAYVTAPGGGRSSRSTYDIDTRSKESRAKYSPNNTGIPQIGDM